MPNKDEFGLALARVEAKLDAMTMDFRRLVDRETKRNGRLRELEIRQAEEEATRKAEKEERKAGDNRLRWVIGTAIGVAALAGPLSEYFLR